MGEGSLLSQDTAALQPVEQQNLNEQGQEQPACHGRQRQWHDHDHACEVLCQGVYDK